MCFQQLFYGCSDHCILTYYWWCRAVKLKQRQNHEKLAQGKSVPLSLNTKYYLLPSSWLSKWRTYINASGKTGSSCVEPDRLDAVVSALMCQNVSKGFVSILNCLIYNFLRHGISYSCSVMDNTLNKDIRYIGQFNFICCSIKVKFILLTWQIT